MKTCCKCKASKELSEFYKHSSSKDGVQTVCKECQRAMHKAYANKKRDELNAKRRAYNSVNKEKVRAVNKRQYAKNAESNREYARRKLEDPVFREERKQYLRDYYAKHKERLLRDKREFYAQHIEIFRERNRNWRQTES